MTDYIVYTDGACSGNPGPGGWGVYFAAGLERDEFCGGEAQTTNNRMELMAAIFALNAVPEGAHIVLYTDSKYVKDGILSWIDKWKQNRWRTAARKPVKNMDLWQALDTARACRHVEWKWVKGHIGIEGNERADALARKGMADFV